MMRRRAARRRAGVGRPTAVAAPTVGSYLTGRDGAIWWQGLIARGIAAGQGVSMHEIFSPQRMVDTLAVWGYLGIFVCVFVGNLGLPVPEETVILAAGFLAGRDILELKAVYLVVIASAVVGDSCGFAIGRKGGQRLLARLADRFEFVRTRYQRLQAFFQVHGSKAVFMARFLAGARFMAGPMAGAAGMSFWRFLGWNVLGALVWCPLVVTVGYLLGDEIWRVARLAHTAQWVILGVIVVFIAAALFWWRERRHSAARP